MSDDTRAPRTTSPSMLDELITAWRYTRDGVIAEVENFPDAHFAERPPGLLRSALDLANHIIESGRLMGGELSRRDGDFTRRSYAELLEEHTRPGDVTASKAQALDALRRSCDEDSDRLGAVGLTHMQHPIRQFNGEFASRLAWMHHGIAHEEYHRGQIALCARLFGSTPALTRLIQSG
jgi:uncharacterized damage-inducible protein DinB